MNFLSKLMELVFDFARGVHLWPLVDWLLKVTSSASTDTLVAELANADLHRFVAIVVLGETVSSFLGTKK